jgi:hypothetical protein
MTAGGKGAIQGQVRTSVAAKSSPLKQQGGIHRLVISDHFAANFTSEQRYVAEYEVRIIASEILRRAQGFSDFADSHCENMLVAMTCGLSSWHGKESCGSPISTA